MWLRSFSIQFKVLLGFTLAMLGIGYFLYTTYENAQFSIQESSANKDQLKVMLQVEDISTEMQDIENAYRGYVITGDSTYLFPDFKARNAVNKDLTALLESTKINESQHQLALQLSESSKVFFAHVDSIVNFMDRGDIKNAVALVKSNRGKKDMQIIQSCTSQIENHGRSFLNEANVKKEQIASHTRSNFLTLSLVLLLNLFIVYLIIIRDLKKNEESKLQLKKANETILNIYDEAPNGYLTIDPNGVILDINQTAVKWFNYPIEEIAGKMNFGSLFLSPKFKDIEGVFFKTPFSNLEADLVSAKGELIEFLIDTRVIFSPDGELNCVRATLTCYRDLKKAQKQSKYLAMLIENTNDAIVSVNADLTIKTWNKGAEKMYGFDESEAIGKNFVELLQIEAKEKDYDDMWKSLDRSGTWSSEAKHYKKGGAPIYVLNSVSKFTISNQNDILLISITKDITDHKLYQRSLRRFNEELLTKVEEKTEELTNIFTRISEGFVSLDKNLNFIYVNPFAENFLQRKKEELLGKNIFDFYEVLPDTTFRTKIFNSIRNKEFLEIEQYSIYFQKWIHLRIFPSEAGTSFFLQDTTARKEFENKLIENEKKYRLLFQNNPLPMFIIELESYSILDVNQSAILSYGYSAEEFQNIQLEDLRPENEKAKYLSFIKSVDENNFNAGVWTHMKKNGQLMQVEIIAYSMSINSKPCRLILCNDVTDKIKTQEEIKHSRDQLRQLSSHLEKVREDERTSIAREIHDELGQQLTGLKMDASWIAKKIKSDDDMVNVKIEGMIRLIDDMVKTVRKIASVLRPGILDDLGLVAALDWQSREFEKRTGINCSFSYDSLETNFNKLIATGIFRIYQEALTNVARHAKASAVVSSLRVTADAEVEMIISDNGIGIPQSNKERKTLGLIGMSERAIMLNGILKIHSNVGKGTTIKLKIPLQN